MKWMLILACIASGPIAERDSDQIDADLRQAAARKTPFAQRLYDAAREALGTLYQDGPRGEGPEGKYDTDPSADFGEVSSLSLCEISPNA